MEGMTPDPPGMWDAFVDARQDFAADAAVGREPGRRDWIEVRLADGRDLERLARLLAIAVAANA
jgi:hypothetical protein